MRVRGRMVLEEDPQELAVGWGDYGEAQAGPDFWLYTCLLGRQALWKIRAEAHAGAIMQSIAQRLADRSINRWNSIDTIQAVLSTHDEVRRYLTWQLHEMGLSEDDEVIIVRPQELLDDADLSIGDARLQWVETRRHRYMLGEVRGNGREVTRFPLVDEP